MILHAGLVARRWGGRWRGVLIQGSSGTGKSDLALRLMSAGYRLVADDRVSVWASGGRLYGRAPAKLNGLIEVRGVGVVTAPALPFAEVSLAVRHTEQPERCPEPEERALAGVDVIAVALNLLHASAPERVLWTWRARLGSDAPPHRLDSAERERI